MINASNGQSRIVSRGLGDESVNGRSRPPRPAARISADTDRFGRSVRIVPPMRRQQRQRPLRERWDLDWSLSSEEIEV